MEQKPRSFSPRKFFLRHIFTILEKGGSFVKKLSSSLTASIKKELCKKSLRMANTFWDNNAMKKSLSLTSKLLKPDSHEHLKFIFWTETTFIIMQHFYSFARKGPKSTSVKNPFYLFDLLLWWHHCFYVFFTNWSFKS